MTQAQQTYVSPAVHLSQGPARPRTALARPGGRLAAALAAGAALALATSPAQADAAAQAYAAARAHFPERLADTPQDPLPVIAPGATAPVRIGLRNTSDWNGENYGRMKVVLYAPGTARFADDTLAPVGDALGPWRCHRSIDARQLFCVSDYKGVVVPAGQLSQWQVNLAVPADVPYGTQRLDGFAMLSYNMCTPDPVDEVTMHLGFTTGAAPA